MNVKEQKKLTDKIEKLHHSTIQHGKMNDRIYLMNLDLADKDTIINDLNILATQNNYSKIFAKVKAEIKDVFLADGYITESTLPNYYNGKSCCYVLSKFLTNDRATLHNAKEILNVLSVAQTKANSSHIPILRDNISIRQLIESDIKMMVKIYKVVFETYPFPIHDENYIKNTMKENVIYYGIFENNKLLGIASSELNLQNKNAEMTDFAILPEYRGQNFALLLLSTMEERMERDGCKMLFTIARAVSYGMNSTFSKLGYTFNGTLINNTNISGKIESMNIWYKVLNQ